MMDDQEGRGEEEILATFDKGEWRRASSVAKAIERYRGHARATLAKERCTDIPEKKRKPT